MPDELKPFDDVYPPVVEHAQRIRQRTSPHMYSPHHSAGYNLTFALQRVVAELWLRDDANTLQLADYCLAAAPPAVAREGALAFMQAVFDAADRLVDAESAPDVFVTLSKRLGAIDPAVRTAVMARVGEYYIGAGLAALADVTFVGDAPVTVQDWDRLRNMTARIVAEIKTTELNASGS
jgi:hypothetical protein